METVTPTGYAGYLQTCMLLRKPFVVLPNSTLNQKFGVHADQVPSTNEYPYLGYLGIGNKGASYEIAPGGFQLTSPVPHLPRHSSLYSMIPFVARHVDDDIPAIERSRYRMRVITPIGGENYVVYYLRVLDMASVTPSLVIRNVASDVITDDIFSPTSSDLSPTHPIISNPNLNTPDGDYLVTTAKSTFTLNQADIVNIREACQLIYGDPRYANITEVALCTGIDKPLTGSFGGTTSTYTEVIAAQVAAFVHQSHNLTETSTEVRLTVNVGNVAPLRT
ncbi:MAG: hypothetical protein PHN51_11625 [Candidatus Nanopelagicales bacterium]|nr:hypothetical protein [Candidatus Nanopelagicales bacterium]